MMPNGLMDHFPLALRFSSRTLIHGALMVAGFGQQLLVADPARRFAQVDAWSFAAELKGKAEPVSTYFTRGTSPEAGVFRTSMRWCTVSKRCSLRANRCTRWNGPC